ncbi:MAG TPA: hypothetical protein VF817_01090 [Patescibacteria group bacterium]
MQWKQPKNTSKYHWTDHVQMKMHYYGLSQQKVLGVINRPRRIETGIVEDTVAVMQPAGTIKKDENGKEKWSQEIWVLYKVKSEKLKVKSTSKSPKIAELQKKINTDKKLVIISAWRYPGVAPERDPIPGEILREIEEMM